MYKHAYFKLSDGRSSSGFYNCTCACGNTLYVTCVPSIEELAESVKQLKRELKVNKTKLTRSWLKKNCAKDDRPSVVATGYVGLGCICFVAFLVILVDISSICKVRIVDV